MNTKWTRNPMSKNLHRRIKHVLMGRYDTPVMNNTDRAAYIECLVTLTLGDDWQLTWMDGWEWAPWDCQHKSSGVRLEVKHAAARQSWDREMTHGGRVPRFDIAPRKGYWRQDGSAWVDTPGRLADLYVFAWHDESRHGYADQRNANQWSFFVVDERYLPKNQKSIGLKGLKSIVFPCRIMELKRAVEDACPALGALKAILEPSSSCMLT